MINLHESMGPDRDRTRDPWICSQTRICSQTCYRLRYAARYLNLLSFTRIIVGRGAKQSNPAGCIMWTSMCIPQTLNSFSPNHFVPLVKKNESTLNIVVCLDDSEQELNCTNTEKNAGSVIFSTISK